MLRGLRSFGLAVALPATLVAAGCAREQSQPPPKPRPPQAGQPMDAVETAARIAAMRAQAVVGDRDGLRRNMDALNDDMRRSMKLADPARPIDHEQARAAIRSVEGVRSVAWIDRANLLVIVDRNDYRTQATIDAICIALDPIGDTLAVVVNLQSGAATTGDDLEILSRNCQLAPGDRAFLQAHRQIDVIDPKVRALHKASQVDTETRDRKKEQEESMRILEQSTPAM